MAELVATSWPRGEISWPPRSASKVVDLPHWKPAKRAMRNCPSSSLALTASSSSATGMALTAAVSLPLASSISAARVFTVASLASGTPLRAAERSPAN